MKEIALTQGQFALVDDCEYERLSQFKWYAHKNYKTFYAVRHSPRIKGKRYLIYMHHKIIGKPPKNYVSDHENGNGLDNQRENLRFVTHRQNSQNRKNKKGSSEYPGVCWHERDQRFQARITINGISNHS